jgi:hypothetical protein
MYDYLEAAIAINRISATLETIEYHAYRLDKKYQEYLVPWLVQGVVFGLEAIALACVGFWHASVWTFALGRRVGGWWVDWMAEYCDRIPVIQSEFVMVQMLALMPAKEPLLLCAGIDKPVKKRKKRKCC